MELDENRPPVKDDRKELEDRDATCGMLCGSSVAVPERMDDLDAVDGPMYRRVKKTIHWVSVMDGLQRVLVFADDENLSCLTRKVRLGFGSTVTDLQLFSSCFLKWRDVSGYVYTDAVSNRNGFMTWKPHRKRHGFKEFTMNLSNRLCRGDLVLRPLRFVNWIWI